MKFKIKVETLDGQWFCIDNDSDDKYSVAAAVVETLTSFNISPTDVKQILVFKKEK